MLACLQDLHRDPAELLSKQLDNQHRMEERREEYQEAAPGRNLDERAGEEGVAQCRYQRTRSIL